MENGDKSQCQLRKTGIEGNGREFLDGLEHRPLEGSMLNWLKRLLSLTFPQNTAVRKRVRYRTFGHDGNEGSIGLGSCRVVIFEPNSERVALEAHHSTLPELYFNARRSRRR
jgi:hypothetical protein